ncbi:MAG: methyltransferase domain-containing protein [Candidatus Edwardsbacteria bacterium]
MDFRGDTKRQAILRNKMIKKGNEIKGDRYISKIFSILKPRMRMLDIGCGTAHIIRKLATCDKSAIFVGLDISPAMIKIAGKNTMNLHNVILVEGDGLKPPFPDCSFDIVITRLAEFSPEEVYRILKEGGHFLEYGIGPEADKEIVEFFPDRIEKENFFIPKSLNSWKDEVSQRITDAGFIVENVQEYIVNDYYENEEGVMDLIEMVPLVRDFNREQDKKRVGELAEKYKEKRGIKITWHYYILKARRR